MGAPTVHLRIPLAKFLGVPAAMYQQVREEDLTGPMSKPTSASAMLEGFGMARAESMEITNDPRFFTDNVINYRLAAFGSTGILSGLFIGQAMSDIMGMDKNMDPTRWIGCIQLSCFTLLCVILFFNVLATYVSVAQPYHCYRLMTSGPTGFECAASYYLNKNIATYRHLSVKCMMVSLPLYIIQMGLRVQVKFDRGNKDGPDLDKNAPLYSDLEGVVFGSLLIVMGLFLFGIHYTHFAVFQERYAAMTTPA